MFTNISKVVTIVSTIIVLSLLLSGCTISAPAMPETAPEPGVAAPPAEAAEAPAELVGTGPDFPMMPGGEWMQIKSGEYQWYAFTYDFDADFEPIEIRMYTEPEDGAILTIRNAEQAQMWREDGTHEHVGCCTVQVTGKDGDDDIETPYALWVGELDSSGTYYLVVEHAKNLTDPVSYRFEFASAEGVAMPAELYAPIAEMPQPETQPQVMVSEMALEVEVTESGPDFAMMPTGEWVALEKGQMHWYAFDYDFDTDFEPIEIRMYTEVEDGAVLTIRNAEQAQMWREDGTNEHLGCCTVQVIGKDDDGDIETPYAVWAGTLDSSGRYYLVVEYGENMTGTAYYRFEFAASDGVSFPDELVEPFGATEPSPAPVIEAEPAALPEAMPLAGLEGSGPDFALTPASEWTEIGEGAYHWYAFKYDFDKDFEPFEIRMFTEPEDGAILTIRNAEQAQMWREDGTHEHVGCCTVQDLGDEDTEYALWAGTLDSTGTYYIVVEHAKNVSGPVYYMFTMEGEGVSY